MGKRLVDVLSESYDIRDRFVCVEGAQRGRVLYWDVENDNALSDTDLHGYKVNLAFSHGGTDTNKWVIIKA